MPRTRPPVFPDLEKQILMRGIRKQDISETLHISSHTLSKKLTGQVEFTLLEVEQIGVMFPETSWETLFERAPNEQSAANTPPTG